MTLYELKEQLEMNGFEDARNYKLLRNDFGARDFPPHADESAHPHSAHRTIFGSNGESGNRSTNVSVNLA